MHTLLYSTYSSLSYFCSFTIHITSLPYSILSLPIPSHHTQLHTSTPFTQCPAASSLKPMGVRCHGQSQHGTPVYSPIPYPTHNDPIRVPIPESPIQQYLPEEREKKNPGVCNNKTKKVHGSSVGLLQRESLSGARCGPDVVR